MKKQMKKTFLILPLVAFVLVLCLVSCKKNKPAEQVQEDPALVDMPTTMADTTAVTNLVNEFFYFLKEKHVDKAVSMLYYLDKNGLIVPLPDELKKNQTRMLKFHAGLDYKIDYIRFHKETDSEVQFTCILFEKEPGDTRPNEVKFMLRPMRSNGEWFLTLADTASQTNESDLFKPKYSK